MNAVSATMSGTIGLLWSGAMLASAATAMPRDDTDYASKYLVKERLGHVRSFDQMFLEIGSISAAASATTIVADPPLAREAVSGLVIESLQSDSDEFHNGVLADIVSLSSVKDGWDGPDSVAPTPIVIADAVAVARVWPMALGEPIVDVGPDGTISLDLLDDNGFLVAGVDLVGGDHRAVFSIVKGSKVLASGAFNASKQTEVIQTFDLMRATV